MCPADVIDDNYHQLCTYSHGLTSSVSLDLSSRAGQFRPRGADTCRWNVLELLPPYVLPSGRSPLPLPLPPLPLPMDESEVRLICSRPDPYALGGVGSIDECDTVDASVNDPIRAEEADECVENPDT